MEFCINVVLFLQCHRSIKAKSIQFIVTVTKTPGRARSSTGTKDFWKTIGKFVAVVAQGTVASKFTLIVPCTPLNAIHT